MNTLARLIPLGACLILTAAQIPNARAATNTWRAQSGLRPDQTIHRWTLYKPAASLPPLADGALTLATPGSASELCYYEQRGDKLALPTLLVMEAELRFVSGTTTTPSRAAAGIGFTTAPSAGNLLQIDANEIFLLSDYNTKGASAAVDTTTNFHTYRVEVDGTAAGSPIRVYYDGALTLSGALYADSRQGSQPLIFWGDGSSFASGVSEWRAMSHNAGVGSAIWGVKSKDVPAPSSAPATLFQLGADSTTFNTVGTVTLNGTPIDVDGLALSPEGVLYGFQVRIPGSRLVKLDKSTANAVTIGSVLGDRDFRGAAFTLAGKLVALDVAQKQVVEVNPTTGEILSSVPLQVTTSSGVVEDVCDITQSPDGSVWVAWNFNELHAVDLKTGQTRLIYRDPVRDRQGDLVLLTGLAFSPEAANPATLFTYEVSQQDDIYTYQTDAGFARSLPWPNLIGSYNAGRGDLAALPPLRCQVTDFSSSIQNPTLKAVFPAGRYAWLEWTADLSVWKWLPLTNSVVPANPFSEVWHTNATWNMPTTLGSQAFIRVACGSTPPMD